MLFSYVLVFSLYIVIVCVCKLCCFYAGMEKILSAFICHHHVFTNPFYNSQPSSCGCKPSSCLHATITTTFVEGFLYTKREKRHMYFKMLCQIQRCIVHTYHAAKIILQPSHLCFAAHTYLISNF